MSIKSNFEKALKDVQSLKSKPNNEVLLELYSYYKQATVGDVEGKKPGITDFKGRAKYDAWTKLKGIGKEPAMKKYIEIVNHLIKED